MKKSRSKDGRPTTEDINLEDVEFVAEGSDDTVPSSPLVEDVGVGGRDIIKRPDTMGSAPKTEEYPMEEIEFEIPPPRVVLPEPSASPEAPAKPSGVSLGEDDIADTGPPLEADELYAISGKRPILMLLALGLGATALLILIVSMVCVLRPSDGGTEMAEDELEETTTLIAGSSPPSTPPVPQPIPVDAGEQSADPESPSDGPDADAHPSPHETPTDESAHAQEHETPNNESATAQRVTSSAAPASRNAPSEVSHGESNGATSPGAQRADEEPDPVRAAVRRLSPSLRSCFRRREREGTVMISYRVSADGSIHYNGAHPSPSLGAVRCIRGVVARARVNPAPATERTLSHPVVFLRSP